MYKYFSQCKACSCQGRDGRAESKSDYSTLLKITKYHHIHSLVYSTGNQKTGNDQELIQSNTTFYPQNQKGKKHTHKLINFHDTYAR